MGAPKGNKFALGNKGNTKKKYTDKVKQEILEKLEKYIEDTEIPIVAEFAYLNKIPRQTLYEYDEWRDSLKRLIDKKEFTIEKKMYHDDINTTGAVFSLKQLGWRDKKELEHSTLDDKPLKFEIVNPDEDK